MKVFELLPARKPKPLRESSHSGSAQSWALANLAAISGSLPFVAAFLGSPHALRPNALVNLASELVMYFGVMFWLEVAA